MSHYTLASIHSTLLKQECILTEMNALLLERKGAIPTERSFNRINRELDEFTKKFKKLAEHVSMFDRAVVRDIRISIRKAKISVIRISRGKGPLMRGMRARSCRVLESLEVRVVAEVRKNPGCDYSKFPGLSPGEKESARDEAIKPGGSHSGPNAWPYAK
jgi:hypothetical protein